MKVGGIYLIKFSSVYYIIKILEILEIMPDVDGFIYHLVNYEYIGYSVKTNFGKGTINLSALRSSIIKPLNRKIWYKAVREKYCNGDSRQCLSYN